MNKIVFNILLLVYTLSIALKTITVKMISKTEIIVDGKGHPQIGFSFPIL